MIIINDKNNDYLLWLMNDIAIKFVYYNVA